MNSSAIPSVTSTNAAVQATSAPAPRRERARVAAPPAPWGPAETSKVVTPESAALLDRSSVVVVATRRTPAGAMQGVVGGRPQRVVMSHALDAGQLTASKDVDAATLEAIEREYTARGFDEVAVYRNYIHAGPTRDPREEIGASAIDPLRAQQFHLALMHVAEAHALTRGEHAKVAVLDDGYDPSHPDNPQNLKPVYDYSDDDDDPSAAPGGNHGQHVATIIGMHTGNEEGGASIAPLATVMPVRWYGGARPWSTQVIVASIMGAVDAGAQIINISYDTNSWPKDPAILKALDYAASKDVLVVASAGNAATQDPARGAIENMVFVASLSGGDGRNALVHSGFSNYGKEIDYAAIGGSVLAGVPMNGAAAGVDEQHGWLLGIYDALRHELGESAVPPREAFELAAHATPEEHLRALGRTIAVYRSQYKTFVDRLLGALGEGYERMSGTSMASPMLAAVAALVRSLEPQWNVFQTMAAVKAGCKNIDAINPNFIGKLGAGAIDAAGAVTMAQHPEQIPANTWRITFDAKSAYLTPSGILDPTSINGTDAVEIVDTASGNVVAKTRSKRPYNIGTNRLEIDLAALALPAGKYELRIGDRVSDAFGRPSEGARAAAFEVLAPPASPGLGGDAPWSGIVVPG